ncbi:MAG: selenocysteine-specific translation elongation factor [Candidatus Koribacter versatilis]|uniref:Selenocysteine-specific elongation factor n=1 Tax=Candidatus Korobacter versatilis TaxID=658062 RepID=A0A932A7V4_9BACT|nr:selenocysteine-specific translation elongation factor [Candidatus Koribacter versatilis]
MIANVKSVVAGTAGHIDHGKTALVKALTGIDADRLAEEKRRGITIDIGFAHLEFEGAKPGERLRIGFVDVPGHEKFIRNMLAGVGGIDLVLLVIAADEAIKPQTREHFDIARLLAVKRGLVALTKSDLVDQDTLDVVRLEIEDFLRGSFLEGAPIVPVSSLRATGLDDLKRELARVAGEVPARDAGAVFRLPIDRVFTMKGHGTVVTGTLISGAVKKEDEVEVFPIGKRVRVRGVQVHGANAEQASAGQRTALNLAGVDKSELARGMVIAPLAPAQAFQATQRLDVQLSLLKSAKPLKQNARVHFHAYTAETVADVMLVPDITVDTKNAKQLAPGATGFAQLRLAEPTLLLPGDRFILRQWAPVITIGGGVVLDADPLPARKMPAPSRKDFLTTLATGTPEDIVVARLARRGVQGLTLRELMAETGWTEPRTTAVIASLSAVHRIVKHGAHLVDTPAYAEARKRVQNAIADFQAKNPLVAGMNKEDLRVRLGIPAEVFEGVLRALTRQGAIEVAGDQVRVAGRGVEMKDEESESKRVIEQAFASAGLKVPALKDVLAGVQLDKTRAHKLVTLLLRDKVLIKLGDDLVFHQTALTGLRRQLAEYKKVSPNLDVAKFKDLTGVSRKYAIPLLEWLDRERVTKRVGDLRVIL